MKAALQLALLLASAAAMSGTAIAQPVSVPAGTRTQALQIAGNDSGGRGHRDGDGARGNPSQRQQEIRPQGDLRGDIYKHVQEQEQEQRQPAPPPPSKPSRQKNGH